MKCPNCKNNISISNQYCPICGHPIESESKQKFLKKRKRKNRTIIISTLLGIVLFIALIIFGIYMLITTLFKDVSIKEYVELGIDQVPTIYKVLGEHPIKSYNTHRHNDETTIFYHYQGLTTEDVEKYTDALLKEGYNLSDYYSNTYVKEADENGYIIIITIDKSTIKYQKNDDNINNYLK